MVDYSLAFKQPVIQIGSDGVTPTPSGSKGDQTWTGVLGRTSSVTVTPVVTASSAYAAGNEVGGLMTFAAVFDTPLSGIIQSALISSKSVQTCAFDLYLFRANPTGSTWTDKTNPAIVAADIANLIGVISFATAKSGLGTHTLYPVDGIGMAKVASTQGLYGVLVITSGTPTFASTSDISVTLNVLED